MNVICFVFLLSSFTAITTQYNVKSRIHRRKRDAVGSLDIVTNNAQPIHADVKNEHGFTEKPCKYSIVNIPPSNIEPGVTFKVLPPKDTLHQSLRKSFPLASSLALVRAGSRLVALVVLAASAAVEFYPVLLSVYDSVRELLSYNVFPSS